MSGWHTGRREAPGAAGAAQRAHSRAVVTPPHTANSGAKADYENWVLSLYVVWTAGITVLLPAGHQGQS